MKRQRRAADIEAGSFLGAVTRLSRRLATAFCSRKNSPCPSPMAFTVSCPGAETFSAAQAAGFG